VKDDWKSGTLRSFASGNSQAITSDRSALAMIETGAGMLKTTLEQRAQGEQVIADLLDMDPDEYAALQAVGSPQNPVDDPQDASDAEDPAEEPEPAEAPQFTHDELEALSTRLLEGLRKDQIEPQYLQELFRSALLMKDQAMVHVRRKPVTSRPKLVFGLRNEQGDLPLYVWSQALSNYGTIGDLPEICKPLLQLASMLCPGFNFNHILFTFYHNGSDYYIPPHRDAAFSKQCEDDYEDKTPIVFVSLGTTRKFVLTTLDVPDSHHMKDLEPHVVASFDMRHGDVFILNGADNPVVKHCLPAAETSELRSDCFFTTPKSNNKHLNS
jgi:alkylated DNA repair dioxygenase AlkB